MTSSLDERDYREKNSWRRWTWNRITERISVAPQTAVALYLASEMNLDEKVAIAKGFSASNLVPIERSPRKIALLRKRGVLCIDSDILNVAKNIEHNIDVLNLDFCCGFEYSVIQSLNDLLGMPHMRRCVVACNFMRGRDPSSNLLRQALIDWHGRTTEEGLKHRGFAAYRSLVTSLVLLPGLELIKRGRYTKELADKQLHKTITGCRAVFNSYRSSTSQTFDTAVFINPLHWVQCDPKEWKVVYDEVRDAELRRKIAAFRAVRTMRLKENGMTRFSKAQ